MGKYKSFEIQLVKGDIVTKVSNEASYTEMCKNYSEKKKDLLKNNDLNIERIALIGITQEGGSSTIRETVLIDRPKEQEEVKTISKDKQNNANSIYDGGIDVSNFSVDYHNVNNELGQLKTISSNLMKKLKEATTQVGVLDKQRDNFFHILEELYPKYMNKEIGEQQLAKELKECFLNIGKANTLRRECKNNIAVLSSVINTLSLNKTSSLVDSKIKTLEQNKHKTTDFSKSNLKQNNLLPRIVKFKGGKDRVSKLTQLRKKYDKVEVMENKNEIWCYNNYYNGVAK